MSSRGSCISPFGAVLWSLLLSMAIPPMAVSQSSDSLYALALERQEKGANAEARVILRTLLLTESTHANGRLLLARLLAWDGQYGESLVEYERILAADPSNADVRFGKAQALAWSQKFDQAKEITAALLKENPSSKEYRTHYAKTLLWSGDVGGAVSEFAILLQQDPGDIEALRGAARGSFQLKNYGESRRWYSQILGVVANDPEARTALQKLTYQSTLELQIGSTQEWFGGTERDPHRTYSAEGYADVTESLKPYFHVSRVDKFNSSTLRYGGGAYVELSRGTQLFGQVVVAPDAQVVPEMDAIVEVTQSLFAPFEGVLSYRSLAFTDAKVQVISPGVTWYVSGSVWLTPRGYFSRADDGSQSKSYLVTLHFQASNSTRLKLGGFLGSETFRATTLNEIRSTESTGFLGGFRTRIAQALALNGEYLYTNRPDSYQSHQVSLSLSFLF